MKNKILTAVSTLMIFVPWTILPLRAFDWALKSPVAEIMISGYAVFMDSVISKKYVLKSL